MKTLAWLFVLVTVGVGSAFATHRASVHLQQDKGMLIAYCIVFDATTAHRLTFDWTHSETGKEVSYTTKRKAKEEMTRLRHGVSATPGTWTVIIINEDTAHGTELARASYTVAARRK